VTYEMMILRALAEKGPDAALPAEMIGLAAMVGEPWSLRATGFASGAHQIQVRRDEGHRFSKPARQEREALQTPEHPPEGPRPAQVPPP
jgi:hypothetical protein